MTRNTDPAGMPARRAPALRNILAVMYREYKIRITSITWSSYDLAVPLFYLLFFGIGLNNAFSGGVTMGGARVPYNDFFLAGVIAMAGFGIAINVSYGFFVDRDNGIFYEFLTYPMTRGELLVGKILFSACITSIQALITLTIGGFALGIRARMEYLPLLLAANMVLTAGWFFALAIVALRIRRNDYFNAALNVLYFVLMFASSLFFPLDNSPAWLRTIAYANPMTWHADILRFLTIGAGTWDVLLPETIAYLLFASLALAGGIRTLKHDV